MVDLKIDIVSSAAERKGRVGGDMPGGADVFQLEVTAIGPMAGEIEIGSPVLRAETVKGAAIGKGAVIGKGRVVAAEVNFEPAQIENAAAGNGDIKIASGS